MTTPRSARVSKVAIVGAGSVGATIAYACLIRGVAGSLALYDINRTKVSAEVLDLGHGMQFMPMAQLIGGADPDVCRGADVVVVTAGAKQKPGQTRLELAATNVEICRQMLPQLMAEAPDAIWLMVTNPVDVVTYAAVTLSGLAPRRVFGSGTVLDSSRLRFGLAGYCGVAVQNVHAYIAGEHGDSEIPLWSSATIGGVPVCDWDLGGVRLDEHARSLIARDVVDSAERIIRGKGATNFAIGMATARIIEAILGDENRILPVSSLLSDYHGIGGVCMSIPSIVNRQGVAQVLDLPYSESELAGLTHSAATLRQAASDLGL